jgi:hypothetical protein
MKLPTPKHVFANGEHAKRWADITASNMWTSVVHAALAQLSMSANGADPGYSLRVQGAKEFAVMLTNLSEATEQQLPDPKKLKY